MAEYSKLIVAIVGVVVMLVNRYLGIDLGFIAPAIVDAVIGGLTAFGVWAVKNEPPKSVSS
jgi:uncharacterized membrane protein YwaF